MSSVSLRNFTTLQCKVLLKLLQNQDFWQDFFYQDFVYYYLNGTAKIYNCHRNQEDFAVAAEWKLVRTPVMELGTLSWKSQSEIMENTLL